MIALYTSATLLLLYIAVALLWMVRDLFSGNATTYLRERVPHGGRHARLWRSLFAIFIIAGFMSCTYFLMHEWLSMTFLTPIPFFLLARAVSSPVGHVRKKHSAVADTIVLLLLVSAAALVRCYDISNYPPGLHEDEVAIANDVRDMFNGTVSTLRFSPCGAPRIPSAPLAVAHIFFQRCRATVISYSIVCGIICIPAFYCLASICLPTIFAWLATLLLVVSPYHILYSRATLGATLVLLGIISIYFVITAIDRRSYSRMAFAAIGAAILQYDYCGQAYGGLVILLLGILSAWLAGRAKISSAVLYLSVAIAAFLVMVAPLYYILKYYEPDSVLYRPWLVENKYLMSFDGLGQIGRAIRSSFLMFKDARYGADGVITQANAPCLTRPLLALLFGGVLLSFTISGGWPIYFFGLYFVVSLVPSWLSSVQGNSHRTIMAIIPMYMLSGYSLWILARAVISVAGKRISSWVLGVIIVWISLWGIKYFFNDMWKNNPESPLRMESLWRTSEIRVAEAAWDLYANKYKILMSRPPLYWLYLDNCQQESQVPLTFLGMNWLPENWDYAKRAVILSEDVDGPVFNTMKQWAWPYRWEEKYYPIGGARLLIGKMDERGRMLMSPEPVMRLANGDAITQWDGSLMFSKQYTLMPGECAEGAEIHIDGRPLPGIGENVVFAAGLHDVRILSHERAEDEPSFKFDISELNGQSAREVTITPSMLYAIPVYGWVHAGYQVGEPSRVDYFAVEPFVYYNAVWKEIPSRPKEFIHEWKSRIRLEEGEVVPFDVSHGDGDIEVYIDGNAVAQQAGGGSVAFQIKGVAEEQTVLIRWKTVGSKWWVMLTQDKKECPPHDLFQPSASDRFRYENGK